MKKTLVPFMVASTLAFGVMTPVGLSNPTTVEASTSSIMYSTEDTSLFVSKHQKSKKLIGTIAEGQKVWVFKHEGSWSKVRVNGLTGYIPKSKLSNGLNITAPSIPSASKETHTVKSKVNLKAGKHQTGYKTLLTIPKGAKISLVKEHGSWAEIVYKGKKGFVAKNVLLKLASSTNPSTPVKHPSVITNGYLEKYLPTVASPKGSFKVGGVGDTRQVTYYFKDVMAPIVSISTGSNENEKPFGIQVSIREVLISGISTAERTARYQETERIAGIAIDTIYASSPKDAEVVKKEIFGLMAEQHQAIIRDRKQMMHFHKEKTITIGNESKKMVGVGSTLIVFF